MPKLLTPEEYEAEFGGGFRAEAPRAGLGTRLGASVDRAQAGLLGIGEAVGLPLGDMRRANQFESQESLGRFFRDNPDEPQSWRDIDGVGSAGRYIRGLAIDSAPELTTSLATGGAGALMGLSRMGRVGLAAAANYPAAVGDILQNQRDEGGRTNIGAASVLGVPYAAADLVGLDAALAGGRMARTGIKRLDDMQGFRGGLARTGANVGLNAPIEGASETFQEGINQLGRMAVNPSQTLFNDEANERYLDSFIGGAALGGSASAALGGWRRSAQAQPRTVDEGQFDLTGQGNPPTAPQFNLTTEMDPLQGRINQNLGLQRTPLRGYEQQFLEAFNEPSGRFVSDPQTGVERELTAGELQQMELGELKAQEEAATRREQQIAQETLLETSKALGVTPVANITDAYDVLGARVYGQPQVAKIVQEVAIMNSQLPPEQQQINAAILGANLVNMGGKTSVPDAKKIANAVAGKLKQLQLEGVDSVARAAEILNDQVATLVAAGKNEGDVKLGQIATVYEKLTGQTPPALGGKTAPAATTATTVAEKQQPKFQRAPAPEGQTNVSRAATPAGPAAPSVDGRSSVVPGSVVDPGRDAAVDQGVGGDAGVAGPSAQQAPLLPDANAQQPAAVETNPLDALLAKHFNGDARKSEIAKAYLSALKLAPKGSKGKVIQTIATKFGIKPVTVRSYGNTTELRTTAASMGFTPEQIEELDLPDNTKSAPKAKGDIEGVVREDGVTELRYMGPRRNADKNVAKDPAKTQAMAAAGFETAEDVESSGFGGMDESNTWKQGREGMGDTANSKDEAKANEIASLMDQQDALRNLIEEYEQNGQTDLIEGVQGQIEELQSKLDASLKALEDYLSGKAKKVSAKVGKEIAKEQKAKEKKAKAAPEAAEDTTSLPERAADAWNEVADSMGSAFPQFQDLSAADQETFTEFGPENWTRQDVIKFAQDTGGDFVSADSTYESRTAGTVLFRSSVGPSYNAKPEQLIDLVDNQGVAHAVSLLHKQGMSHALKSVANWFTTGDANVDWDGVFTMVNGKPSIVLNRMAMMLPEKASITVLHEVGHAIDLPGQNAVFSNSPTLGVTIQGGEIMPLRPGSVMDEAFNYYEENGDNTALSQLLRYPFDRKEHGKLTAQQVRAEVFAQLWAFSNLQGGMQVLRDNMPATAAFMEKVHAKVKATQYTEAGSGQGNQSGQVQDRPQAGRDAYASRSSATPRVAEKEISLLTRTLRTGADAALNKIVFSEDLFKRASKMGLTAAMDMDRIYRERAALTGNIEREVTRIENLFNRIPEAFKGTGPRSANQFLYDSTRENKWGFTPTWRGADASKVKVDAGLAARYNAMPKEARAWVSAVLQHGDKMLKMKKDTLIASTNSEYDALIADAKQRGEDDKAKRLEADKAASLRQFQRLFATTEFNPYAPMRRFGDFVVIGKSQKYLDATPAERTKLESDPDHYHVSFAESRASALELERQLKDQGSFSEVSARAKEEARGDMYGGLMDAFNKLRQNIDSELGNATEPKEIAALRAARETVSELYLQSLAENSSRKAEMRRRGVAGEIDMLRSFSTQGRADAHFLASAKYNPQASEAVVKMRQQAKEGGSQLEKSDAFKEIMARHTQSMRYEQGGWFDVAANTSRVTSIWMLSTNPMYYFQNLTQPFVLSLPFMTGKHNWSDAAGQILRSYFQLGDLLKSAKLGEGFDFTKVSKDKNEQDMILKLVDRGRIDIGMDTELGQVKLENDNVVSKAASRGDQLLRSLSQKVEAVNRVSTALAAYRLEIKKGSTPAQALEYADEVISQTHGDYSRINAPRLFNTPGGKVALQFRKFQLIQLTLLSKLVYNSFKGGTPAEKAAARKILTFTLAHTGVLAGVVGMPGFAAAAFIINKLADAFGDDDEPYNLENELRKMLGGGDVARLVMRGAPTLVGADLSGKLGMGNALSILPYTDFDASREGFNAIATGLMLGATGGLGGRVFQALGDMKDGDYYRGLMGLSPSGVSQAIKAFVEASQGETNRRGDTLVSADEIGTFETFAKMIGFPTSAGAERRFDRQIAFDNKEAFESKASRLKNEYSRAVRSNDSDARRQAIEKWQRLQNSRREAGFKPQPLSTLMKAPQEQAKRERNTSGGVQFNTQNRQFVQEQTAN